MKLYLSGRNNWFRKEPLLSLLRSRLFSFAYAMDKPEMELCKEHGASLCLDSGAYSFMNKGLVVEIDKLIEYSKSFAPGTFDFVAALDVIGNAEASWKNYLYMRDAGVDCVPCFHYGEPFEFLDEMVAKCDYIALGGMANMRNPPAVLAFLDQCWARIVDGQGRARVKVHGFAITSPALVMRYPWYSVDSSSWLMNAASGRIVMWNGNRFIDFKLSERLDAEGQPAPCADPRGYLALSAMERAEVDRLLAVQGLTAAECIKFYYNRFRANAFAYYQLEGVVATTFKPPSRGLFDF